MLPQQFQSPEPPKKAGLFMEKFGWPTAVAVVGGTSVIIVGNILLGKIQVLDFNWLMLILGLVMFAITIFLIWYYLRTKQKLQEQYNKNIANIKSDVLVFKNDVRKMREEETHNWNEWAISFSQASDKEHRERSEELKRQCLEAISDAELRLDVSVKNAQSIFTGSMQSLEFAVDSYRQQLIHAMNRMDALEERLKKDLLPDSTEQSSEIKIPPV